MFFNQFRVRPRSFRFGDHVGHHQSHSWTQIRTVVREYSDQLGTHCMKQGRYDVTLAPLLSLRCLTHDTSSQTHMQTQVYLKQLPFTH